ncbi:MAG: hypothetical protein GC159_12755 [Phycisphaera sp.]|nr:hypothetical protein [Phycisphaera sp.]
MRPLFQTRMQIHARLFLVLVALVAGATNTPAARADEPTTPAFTFALVDGANSAVISPDKRSPIDEATFNAHFAAITEKAASRSDTLSAGSQVVLAFKEPVVIGTAAFGSGYTDGGRIVVQTLRSDFDDAVSQAADADWRDIASVEVFPAGFTTRAVRLVVNRNFRGEWSWLAWKQRLTNLTPVAVGSGEKAPFGSRPNAIPMGESWTNTGRDPRPNSPKHVPRAAVSDVLPSWYILSWDAPQTIDAMWLSCNADTYAVYVYRGESDLNPAVAPKKAWRRIEPRVLHEQLRDRDRLHDRLLAFDALKTIAIKVEMTACQRSPIAVVDRMDAFTSSPAATVDATAQAPPGKAIAFEQPFDGQLAVVVTDEAGRHVRNLVAQVDRKRGPTVEYWDLKDETGQVVPAGRYRWKAIASPQIGLKYQTAVYPNAPQFFSDRTPWLTGESGPNGWLADHSSIHTGAASGDRVYFGAPGVESGVGLIECDLSGKKLWGKHGFRAFSGVGQLAGDGRFLYIQENDALHRLDPQTHQIERIATLTGPERQGRLVGITAHDGVIAMSWNAAEPWLDNATRADVVDLEHCLPWFPAKIPNPTGNQTVEPMPRVDFLRLLRLTGAPAGQNDVRPGHRETQFPITLDTVGTAKQQYILLAFKEAIPLGSVVLPNLGPEYVVDLAVHKTGAKYPPNPNDESQWQPAPQKPRPGSWTCVPMPPDTRTRALRIRVRRKADTGEENLIDDLLATSAAKKKEDSGFGLDQLVSGGDAPKAGASVSKADWFASFEGLKLLRRRFADLTPKAKVRVSSGEINAAGEWDAKRTKPVSTEDPGVYLLEWPEAVGLAGLAIKEIDGAVTEIDVWDDQAAGGAGRDVTLTDAPGWRNVATYKQVRRDGYFPAFTRADWARYMDGYVSFDGQIKTRAVRLRVTEQWLDSNERGTATMRHDRGGRTLDRRRCSVYGVAALGYLGQEPSLDPLVYHRVELRDGASGKVVREFTAKDTAGGVAESPASLCYGPDGALYGIQHHRVVRIDTNTGATQPELPPIDGHDVTAHRMTVGPDGAFYVYVLPDKNVRVFGRDGSPLRTIGRPGGQKPGPWDAEKFDQVAELVVDAKRQLWVVESQNVPRRIVQYDADGQFVHEFYGNTSYGGGGVLDPHDKSRLFYNQVEFAIDWDTGVSRVKNMLAEWLPTDCVPIAHGGRTYLVESPLSYSSTQELTRIYLYEAEHGTAKPVAAFGEADKFNELKSPGVLIMMDPVKTPKDYTFIWADRNGDARVDAEEVTLEAKAPGAQRVHIGRMNEKMRCWAGTRLYAPTSIQPNGVPIYEATRADRSGSYELNDGSLLSLSVQADDAYETVEGTDRENHVVDAKGHALWRYGTSHPSVSGLYLPPWAPGYVTNEFGVIGHEVASAGDLGEFVVVHANNGMWKIWTADGLLAGQITRHKFDPRSIVDSSRPTVARGQSFDNLTAGQEHFHGYFVKAPDGRYYIVHGHNYIGLWEVTGIDDFKRMSGDMDVTPDDLRTVRARQAELARREVKSQAKTLECLPMKTGGDIPVVAEIDGVEFGIGYDKDSLAVRWTVSSPNGLLRNSGDDFHRYFKTGACLDVLIGVDPAAPANRTAPIAGDMRLLFTFAEGKPQAVLYQPVASGADAKTAWETHTPAGGTTRFDRVVRLTGATLNYAPDRDNTRYTFIAIIPLRELNWQPLPGQLLRFDWGVLTSDDGHTVKRRTYWSNMLATGTSDEALEARLEPQLWGTLVVAESSKAERQLDRSLDGPKKPKAGADILDDLLEKSNNK